MVPTPLLSSSNMDIVTVRVVRKTLVMNGRRDRIKPKVRVVWVSVPKVLCSLRRPLTPSLRL